MNTQEATNLVVHELVRRRRRDDIIFEICQKYGLDWEHGEEFVRGVELERQSEIASGQQQIVKRYGAWIGLSMVIGGFAIAIAMLAITFSGVIIILLRIPIPYLGNAIFFLGGVGIAVRGIFTIMNTYRT